MSAGGIKKSLPEAQWHQFAVFFAQAGPRAGSKVTQNHGSIPSRSNGGEQGKARPMSRHASPAWCSLILGQPTIIIQAGCQSADTSPETQNPGIAPGFL